MPGVRAAVVAAAERPIAQAARAFGLRHARYRGLAKVRLRYAATAAALPLARLGAWLTDRRFAPSRVSRLAQLAA